MKRTMTEVKYAASKAFVKEMRAQARNRDRTSIQQAIEQMREWLAKHLDDIHVDTALEQFDILEEAAEIVEKRKTSDQSVVKSPVARAS
jgi:HD-GYP domain-containing protein (c-di-GMP phosphodiesterase class II)